MLFYWCLAGSYEHLPIIYGEIHLNKLQSGIVCLGILVFDTLKLLGMCLSVYLDQFDTITNCFLF